MFNPENPSGYIMPKPTRIILLDDLSEKYPLTKPYLTELANLFDSKYQPIIATTNHLVHRLRRKYHQKARQLLNEPIDVFIGIGSAGYNIADKLNFGIPIIKVEPTRIVDSNGQVSIVSKTSESLQEQLAREINNTQINPICTNIGLVDDTIFQGHTLASVIELILEYFVPKSIQALTLTHVPYLTQNRLNTLPITSAITLKTSASNQTGLNSIDISDFFDPTALPLTDGLNFSFTEETSWMKTWFGPNCLPAIVLCEKIKHYLA